jgi:hypothetical protein
MKPPVALDRLDPRRLKRLSPRRLLLVGLLVFASLVLAASVVWRDDILRTGLDPKIPFQTYDPPAAPDYTQASAWVLMPARAPSREQPVDVFFVHPTTYDGGPHWNAPIGERRAERVLHRVMLPNYAGPFVRVGRVFAPRYRQASLYSLMTLREDALDARAFAYTDVRDAFGRYVAEHSGGRKFLLVGVEQGGSLAARLLAEEIAPDPRLRARLAAAYLIDTIVPADAYGPGAPIPACASREQPGCVVAWSQAPEWNLELARRKIGRAMVWNDSGRLEPLEGRAALCVNPLLGAASEEPAAKRRSIGAANATGVEWGTRPAFMMRQVAAHCEGGLLRYSRPESASLRPSGSWVERQRAPGFNLFYADLEADAQARVAASLRQPSPIVESVAVPAAPVHRIN